MGMNLVQKCELEVDSKDLFGRILGLLVGIVHGKSEGAYFTYEKPLEFNEGSYLNDPVEGEEATKPQYLHVCSVGQLEFPHVNNERVGVDNLVNEVMNTLNSVDERTFFEQCGDGYVRCTAPSDMSIGVGYRLEVKNDTMHISLCHIEYGQ